MYPIPMASVYMYMMEGGVWGVRARRTSNMHMHVRNCILNGTLVYTHIPHIYYIRIPYLQRPSYILYTHIPYLQRPSYYIHTHTLSTETIILYTHTLSTETIILYTHTISKQYILHKMSSINTHLINNYDTNVSTGVKGLKR